LPELPEVETIRRGLERALTGRELSGLQVYFSAMIKNTTANRLRSSLIGEKVMSVSRRGKYLFLDFSGGSRLEFHLRMTGRLIFSPASVGEKKHLRARFSFQGGSALFFYDQRKFGTLRLRKAGEEPALGIEPLSPQFTPGKLADLLAGRKAPVKNLLLNQQLIAGLGNIYADESLFQAGIDPRRPGGELTLQQVKSLHGAIVSVLESAIRLCGTSFRDYRDSQGERGKFQNLLQVYHRSGQPCPRCGESLFKIRLGGRGTHICPRSQK